MIGRIILHNPDPDLFGMLKSTANEGYLINIVSTYIIEFNWLTSFNANEEHVKIGVHSPRTGGEKEITIPYDLVEDILLCP